MRPADTLSRFGGDEFLILCEDLVGQEDALRLASRARDLLELPVLIDGRELQVTCSIGVALRWPGESPIDATTLVRDADAAMYHVKATGRGGVKLFDDELHRSAMQRLDAEGALRTAVMERQLEVHYQPIVALPGEALYGVEALARWNRPGVGPVAAVEFIRLAEECGLIDELGHCVLRTAMNEVARWYELGLIDDDFMLSVNVSARQLANTKLLSIVRRLVESWPLPAGALCLEITESAVGGDPELANRSLDELRSIGVKLALDDFGVGQSSLEQLVHLLPVDILKLDRAFIADLEHPRDRAVVAAVAPMAEDLGMLVVAEGVESAEQAGLLAELGYQLAQGYYFGRPHVGRAFHEWLSATKDVDRVA
jgi:predicted signal transduction protein with EAL and GGDEF domain